MARTLSLTQVLHTKAFHNLFWSFANREPNRLIVVSPFLGGLPYFKSTVEFARYFLRTGKSQFTLVTRPPERGRDGIIDRPQAEALVALGVDLRIRQTPPLHSKVYQFEFADESRVSFIGSANFTIGGFQTNDETVVFLKGEPENGLVDGELARLVGRGTLPYQDWDLLNKRSGV